MPTAMALDTLESDSLTNATTSCARADASTPFDAGPNPCAQIPNARDTPGERPAIEDRFPLVQSLSRGVNRKPVLFEKYGRRRRRECRRETPLRGNCRAGWRQKTDWRRGLPGLDLYRKEDTGCDRPPTPGYAAWGMVGEDAIEPPTLGL
jgi:hypothetical protein